MQGMDEFIYNRKVPKNVKIPKVGYMLRGDFSKEEWEWLCDEYQISHDTDLIELHFTGIE